MEEIIRTIKEFKEESGRNLVICGPKMGEESYAERSKKLRVYSYGGVIAEIGYSNTDRLSITFLSNAYYAKENKYITGEGQEYLAGLPKRGCVEKKKEVLLDKRYWEYASVAAQKRYSRGEKPKERNIESQILEKYIHNKEVSFCIFDMEFFAPLSWGERYGIKGKPDLVCYDGENFGFIELKYNNKACDDGENKSGLNKHFDDLTKTTKNAEVLIKEFKRRIEICDTYPDEIMDHKLCKRISKANESIKPWFGFLFLNDDGTNPICKIKRSKIDDSARIMCVNNIAEIAEWKWTKRSKLDKQKKDR